MPYNDSTLCSELNELEDPLRLPQRSPLRVQDLARCERQGNSLVLRATHCPFCYMDAIAAESLCRHLAHTNIYSSVHMPGCTDAFAVCRTRTQALGGHHIRWAAMVDHPRRGSRSEQPSDGGRGGRHTGEQRAHAGVRRPQGCGCGQLCAVAVAVAVAVADYYALLRRGACV